MREVVRVFAYSEPPREFPVNWTGWVEIKRPDGTRDLIRTLSRPLPRNRGKARLLICPYCQTSRRGLYGWEPSGRFTNSVVRSTWGVPEMQRATLCVGRRGAPDPSPWNAGPRIRNWSLTAPRVLAPLRVHLISGNAWAFARCRRASAWKRRCTWMLGSGPISARKYRVEGPESTCGIAAMLVGVLAGESPASGTCPVTVVVISGGGEGDQTVGSPEVKVPVGWVKT